MRILAIDYGTKRFGFAIGDTTINTASPIDQLDRKGIEMDIDYIKTIVEEYDISKVLIGYPLNMDGSKSEMAKKTILHILNPENWEKFSELLRSKIDIEIELYDERLTTFEAEEILKSFQSDYQKRKNVKDSISALVLLRDYMGKK